MNNSLTVDSKLEREFLFLLSSARANGNTEMLTRIAASSLSKSISQNWIVLNDISIPKFYDKRHSITDFPFPEGQELSLAEATLKATDIVISSPLYWYTLSANAKSYLDFWSGWMRVKEFDFKKRMHGKNLWAITTTSDAGDVQVEPLIGTLNLIAEYLGMQWCGILIGHGNRPGEVLQDLAAIEMASKLFIENGNIAII